MKIFHLLCTFLVAYSFSNVSCAQTLEEIVQRHEKTLAELNSYRVEVRARPSNKPWGSEYDHG